MRKRHSEESRANNSERWLLTYSDLITLLLVFFVVMYSISKADEKKFSKLNASLQRAFNVLVLDGNDKTAVGGEEGPTMGNSILDDFATLQNKIMQVAKEMGIQSNVDVVLEKEGIAIRLSGNLLFDSGRAELNPAAVRILDEIAQELRGMPNDIHVEGHTDNIPVGTDQYPTNWELSAARATAVTRYLSEIGGINPQRLSAQGYGEYRPIVNNDTRDNRSLNRRVDILIIYGNVADSLVR